MATKIQLRRDLSANWDKANPVLMEGELGIALDKNAFKIGNGISAWNDLPYFSSGDSLDEWKEALSKLRVLGGTAGGSPIVTVNPAENGVELSFTSTVLDGENKRSSSKLTIPTVTKENAGLLSPEDYKDLTANYALNLFEGLATSSASADIKAAFTPTGESGYRLPNAGDVLLDEENNISGVFVEASHTEAMDEGGIKVSYFSGGKLVSLQVTGDDYDGDGWKVESLGKSRLISEAESNKVVSLPPFVMGGDVSNKLITISSKNATSINLTVPGVNTEDASYFTDTVNVPSATEEYAGVMSAADKKKLDEMGTGASVIRYALSKLNNITKDSNTDEVKVAITPIGEAAPKLPSDGDIVLLVDEESDEFAQLLQWKTSTAAFTNLYLSWIFRNELRMLNVDFDSYEVYFAGATDLESAVPAVHTVGLGLAGGTLEQEDYDFIRRLSEDETGSSLLRVMTLDSVNGSPAFAVASVFAEPDDGNVIVTAVLAGGIYGYSSTQEPGKTVRWEISEDRSYVAHVVYDDVLDLNTSPFIGDREDYDLQWFRILKPGVYRLIDSSIPDYSPSQFCGTLQVFQQHENDGNGIILEGSLVMSRKATAQDEWEDVVDGTDSTSGIFSVYQDPDKMNRYVLSWADGQWVHTDLRMTEKERHAKYEPLKLKDFTADGFKIESSTDFKEKLGATFDEVSAAIATGRQVVMFDESKNYFIPLTYTNNIGLLSTYAPDTTADQISVFIGLTIESEIVTLLVIKSKDGEVGGESQKHRIQTQSA